MLEARQRGRQKYVQSPLGTWLSIDADYITLVHADQNRTIGASKSKAAKGEARQGFSEREGTDEDWDFREC